MKYKTVKAVEEYVTKELARINKEIKELDEEIEKEVAKEAAFRYPDLDGNRKLQELTKKYEPLSKERSVLETLIDELQDLELR